MLFRPLTLDCFRKRDSARRGECLVIFLVLDLIGSPWEMIKT
jgi:hypothetical protein